MEDLNLFKKIIPKRWLWTILGVGILILGFGVYEGVSYVQAKGLVSEGDKLMQTQKYEEAIDKYQKAGRKFKPMQKRIASQIDLATQLKKEDESIKQAGASFNQGDWQNCLDYIQEVGARNQKYELAKKIAGDCQQKLDEAAKVAADATANQQTATKGSAGSSTSRTSDRSSSPAVSPPTASSSTEPAPSTSSSDTPAVPDPQPVLSNLGLTGFAPYDASTGKAGPINFRVNYGGSDDYLRSEHADSNTPKAFFPFGSTLPNHTILNPTLEFHYITHGTPVYAAMSGVISSVMSQQNNDWGTPVTDYEFFIKSSSSSNWMVGYDHVQNLTVSEGDTVTAGQQIATTGDNGNGYDRFELQVHYSADMNTQYDVCPVSILNDSVKSSLANALSQLQTDLNAYLGSASYDVSSQNPAGCLADRLN